MAKVAKYDTELGRRYGRPDLERIGFFAEMEYMNGKGYVSPFSSILRKEPTKGRQLFPGGPKTKCGMQDGYFEDEFQRIFEKEAYSEVFGRMMREQINAKKKNLSKSTFITPGPTKQHSSPGDYYGSFEKYEAFSPELKKKPPYKKEKPNFLVNPGKKGGPGYADITISRYPEHGEDYYDDGRKKLLKLYEAHKKAFKNGPLSSVHYPQPYFDPNPFLEKNPGPTYVRPKVKLSKAQGKWYMPSPPKQPGGCKAGCFDKWPEHSVDPYFSKDEKMRKKKKDLKLFYPQAGSRTKQTFSIVNKKVDCSLNETNWRTFEPLTFPNQ